MMKKLAIALGLLLGITLRPVASASEWLTIHSDDQGKAEVDATSRAHAFPNAVRQLERVSFARELEIFPGEKYVAATYVATYYCGSRKRGLSALTMYNKSGTSFSKEAPPAFPSDIAPNSLEDRAFEFACSLRSDGRSDQGDALGKEATGACMRPEIARQCGSLTNCHDDFESRRRQNDLSGSVIFPDYVCNSKISKSLSESNCRADNSEGCTIFLKGEITMEVAHALESFLRNSIITYKRTTSWIYLDSNGGDVDAALKIGRLAREYQLSATVESSMSCASACVFILAGAVNRFPIGPVIIHRPFRSAAVELGRSEAQRLYDIRNAKIRSFLKSMNVSGALLDSMNTVPPEKGKELTNGELESFGLASSDPVYQEEEDAKNASRRGLSMAQFLAEKRRYQECARSLARELGNVTMALARCSLSLNFHN